MRLFLHFATFSVLGLAGVNPQLDRVQSVYIFPMSGGMDQFLANRITHLGKMQVVADPQTADTILTDRIGEPFEKRLDLIYGSAAKTQEKKDADLDQDLAVKTEEKAADKMPKKSAEVKDLSAADAKEKAESDAQDRAAKQKSDAVRIKAAKDKADAQAEQIMRVGSFGRGKGTYFLVDRKTRGVIWSAYEPPKNTSSNELNKTAERVVNHLKRDLKPPVQN